MARTGNWMLGFPGSRYRGILVWRMYTAHEINTVVETGTMWVCGWRDSPMVWLHRNFTGLTFEPAGRVGLLYICFNVGHPQCAMHTPKKLAYAFIYTKVFRNIIKPLFYIIMFGVVFNTTPKKPDFTKSLWDLWLPESRDIVLNSATKWAASKGGSEEYLYLNPRLRGLIVSQLVSDSEAGLVCLGLCWSGIRIFTNQSQNISPI